MIETAPITSKSPKHTSIEAVRVGPQPPKIEVVRTYLRLGIPNLLRVATYRLKKKYGWYERTMPTGEGYAGPFFFEGPCDVDPQTRSSDVGGGDRAHRRLAPSAHYTMFSHINVPVDGAPDWFVNPLNGERIDGVDEHWSRTKDFSEKLGDIKCVWEASRFDWLPQLAWKVRSERSRARSEERAASHRCEGVSTVKEQMESWILDWVRHNPANRGPNWRCGQEVSIRALNMLLTGSILGTLDNPTPAFLRFLSEHARRVLPTLEYAVGQDTNHATSEAAALFLLGHYLGNQLEPTAPATGSQSSTHREIRAWQRVGRRWLEERVRHLIDDDGTFAQYSVNYHRLMLATISLVEVFRKEWNVEAFSSQLYSRMREATNWLAAMTDPATGDGANIGGNDGAFLFNISDHDYRDFRPILNLARYSFFDGQAVEHEDLLQRLTGEQSQSTQQLEKPRHPGGRVYGGGFVRLAPSDQCWGVLRFADFKTRPKECDVLHLDLWKDGVNLLRDGGSYCYAMPDQADYFTGTASHSTVQFDQRNQMRRIGRFLFADWVVMSEVGAIEESNGVVSWSGSYVDYAGAIHRRTVFASAESWIIRDRIQGFQDRAVIRWRLAPLAWQRTADGLESDFASVTMAGETPYKIEVSQGVESRLYLQSQSIPELLLVTERPGEYTTTITWN